MVVSYIIVAVSCAALLGIFAYKHYGKRAHDCQNVPNRERSFKGKKPRSGLEGSNRESWIGRLLYYFDEQCETKPDGLQRIYIKIAFSKRETAFERIEKCLSGTTNSDEAYCWGIFYGYYCRSCKEGCLDEVSGVLPDDIKIGFLKGFEEGMEIFAPAGNDTTSRARFM